MPDSDTIEDVLSEIKSKLDELCVTSSKIEQLGDSLVDLRAEVDKMRCVIDNEVNARTLTLEWLLKQGELERESIAEMVNDTNQRTMTLEWLSESINAKNQYLMEGFFRFLHREEFDDSSIQKKLSAYPNYRLISERSIAEDSFDHQKPESTFEGVVPSPLFVGACNRIFKGKSLKFLDIGCGAGGLVFDFLKQGHFAVGLDGSDACLKNNVGYWSYLDHLHTCDVKYPFKFLDDKDKLMTFDIITMWEVFEHIKEGDCAKVLSNILQHLDENGLFVGSISQLEYIDVETGEPYHITIKEKSWWIKLFEEHGFVEVDSGFSHMEYARGVGNSYQDVHDYFTEPESGFHFVLKKNTEK